MDIRKLQRTIVDALEDVKAQDIQVFNTEALTSLFDRVIIASGTSNRQTRALAASVRDKVREAGAEVRNPEGAESGEWVLVDCGDAVVHIMQPAIRAYYRLEDIWGGKSVHLKSRQEAVAAARAGAAGTPARKAPAGGASKTPRSGAARSARGTAARSAAGGATAAATKAATKAAANKAAKPGTKPAAKAAAKPATKAAAKPATKAAAKPATKAAAPAGAKASAPRRSAAGSGRARSRTS